MYSSLSSASDLLSPRFALPFFQKFLILGKIKYTTFSDWLLSFGKMYFRFLCLLKLGLLNTTYKGATGMAYNTLYIFKLYNLFSFNLCVHPWNHGHNQDSEPVYHSLQFPRTSLLSLPSLSPPLSLSIPHPPLIHFLPLQIKRSTLSRWNYKVHSGFLLVILWMCVHACALMCTCLAFYM